MRAAHAAGLAVNTWTCDDPARIGELIAWGVDGICTNVPDVALACAANRDQSTAPGTRAYRLGDEVELEPVTSPR